MALFFRIRNGKGSRLPTDVESYGPWLTKFGLLKTDPTGTIAFEGQISTTAH